MAVYAIGDIHGCRGALDDLLAHIGFNSAVDTLWLTGDLVNRGPDSLAVLRWAYQNQNCIQMVLGNHDLHLLAAHVGVWAADKNESHQQILQAEDAKQLCAYLRAQPLMLLADDYAMVHAGRLPEWRQEEAFELAMETSARIAADDDFLRIMYGNFPACWHPALSADMRGRVAVNAFSRLRLLAADGSMFLSYSGAPNKRPPGTIPWFDAAHRQHWRAATICGHWSSLGLLVRADLLAIDTGCLWGRQLTAVRLEDRKIFQTPARANETVKW